MHSLVVTYIDVQVQLAAGLCCTIFVPETKGMHLEDAALHSKSHFGQMLSSCGIEQVCASAFHCLQPILDLSRILDSAAC